MSLTMTFGAWHISTRALAKLLSRIGRWSITLSEIAEKYPDVNGTAVIYHAAKEDFPRFHEASSTEGRELSIYPLSSRDVMLPIAFVELEDMNASAVGLDLASVANRRAGLLESRDTG
jgi:CHASE1-domain containing sensor protein